MPKQMQENIALFWSPSSLLNQQSTLHMHTQAP